MNGTPWTNADLRWLRRNYANQPTSALAAKLGRSKNQVFQMAYRLGLRKSGEFLTSCAGRFNKGVRRSAATEFKKGQVPHNKGLRRPGWAPGRMAETQFKPGVRQGAAAKNWKPVGTILKDAEGYLRIKVREGRKGEAYGFGNVKIWPLLNRYVWEQHHGPIPAGHAVVFKDGDRGKCEIGNLECISRGQLMARNTVHNLPKELAEVIQLNGALKRKLRRLSEKYAAGSAQPSV